MDQNGFISLFEAGATFFLTKYLDEQALIVHTQIHLLVNYTFTSKFE